MDPLYDQSLRIGHAVATSRPIELLDQLSQGEKTVQTLAEQSVGDVAHPSWRASMANVVAGGPNDCGPGVGTRQPQRNGTRPGHG
jgi:hypothetical protein